MVRLQSVEVEECTEEGARGEAESTLKVRDEDDSITLARSQCHLASGLAPKDALRHLAGLDEGLNLAGVDGGALPPSPSCSSFIFSGRHGALRSGGARNQRRRETEGQGEGVHTAAAECTSGVRAVRMRRERARRRSPEQQHSRSKDEEAGARKKKKWRGETRERHPRWLIKGGWGCEWDHPCGRVARCGRVHHEGQSADQHIRSSRGMRDVR